MANLLANNKKLITIPRLSPSHTSCRLVEILVPSGGRVVEYTPIMIVRCSPDMIGKENQRKASDLGSRLFARAIQPCWNARHRPRRLVFSPPAADDLLR